MNLASVLKELKKLNLPKNEYVVVGGTMTGHGIRNAHDLDILVTPNLYKSLLSKGFRQCRCKQCLETSRLMLKNGKIDILPNFMFGNYVGDTKKLIKSADMIKGYPFLKIKEFIKFKKELGRPKDFEDIKLMKEYLKKKARK